MELMAFSAMQTALGFSFSMIVRSFRVGWYKAFRFMVDGASCGRDNFTEINFNDSDFAGFLIYFCNGFGIAEDILDRWQK
ncbi:hypothetical protein BGW37DRAFT_498012 [Umbelopsis sp. PMI_123]|nr:hypothetical protein BGW37DRAFT_498012 [Umbelopsis sp. PMI_123]